MKRSLIATAVASAAVSMFGTTQVVFAAEQAKQADEEIIVTGSRIPRANLTAPTAVTTIDSESIGRSGLNNVADVLHQVPSFGVSAISTNNSNFLTTGSGVNTLELRNLGEDRTLVLVNGRRYVSGVSASSAVDFNTIPTQLIDRIEVITGGASAIYGSDALAGVINVILKKDFEGAQFDYQHGEATEGGDIQNRATLTLGGNFAEGRGNAVFSGTYSQLKGLRSAQRSNTKIDDRALCIDTGNAADCKTSRERFFSSFSEFGRFFDPNTGASFTVSSGAGPDGTVSPWSTGTFGFNRQGFRRYSVPTDRYMLSTNINYDMTDTIHSYVEANYVQTRTHSELEPFPHSNSDLGGGFGGIPIDNPFIPAAIRDEILASYQEVLAEDPDNAVAPVVPYFRRMTEIGQRESKSTRNTYRILGGLNGEVVDRFTWDVYAGFGRMDDAQRDGGQINVLNMRQALNVIDDGEGTITCADPIARAQGCVPINLFGKGAISKAAADYVRAPKDRQQVTEQKIAGATFGGDAFELPAGALKFSVGFEYRDESSEDVPDVLTQQGLNAGNKEAPTFGSYDVKEGFIEVEVPLLKDLPAIHELTLGGAYRYSDYSTVGSTDAYTGRLFWAPIEPLRFRFQYARAVRAPNIGELFAPGGENFDPVTDPCDGVTATSVGTIDNNCRAIPAIAARIANTGSFTLTQAESQGTGGFTGKGNQNLDTETADTYSIGFVYNDELGPVGDLTLSVDYFDIKIDDLIDTIDRQTSIDFCFNSTAFPNQFCNGLIRDTTGPAFEIGELTDVNSGFINEGSLKTTGIDVAMSLRSDLSEWFGGDVPGSLAIRGNYVYTDDYTERKFGAKDDRLGEVGYAENKFQTAVVYSIGAFSAQWEWNFIGDSKPSNSNPLFGFDVGTYQTHDFQFEYDLSEAGWTGGYFGQGSRVYLGINNAFDEDAPRILSNVPGNTTGTDTNADVYDPVGRTWFLGLSVSLQ